MLLSTAQNGNLPSQSMNETNIIRAHEQPKQWLLLAKPKIYLQETNAKNLFCLREDATTIIVIKNN